MCNCKPKKYSKTRACVDIFLSLCTGGLWSIYMAYSRHQSEKNR